MKKKQLNIFILLALLILSLGEAFGLYKIYRHNQYQDKIISEIRQDVGLLKFAVLSKSELNWEDDAYNYLALGNSITKHAVCDYWWSEMGMAASSESNDYFHLVSSQIKDIQALGG